MIGSLLNDLQPDRREEPESTEANGKQSREADSDENLLSSLDVVQRIVRRRGLFSLPADAADVMQDVALRILKWSDKCRQKSGKMSKKEWRKFAARIAFNEINRHFS